MATVNECADSHSVLALFNFYGVLCVRIDCTPELTVLKHDRCL